MAGARQPRPELAHDVAALPRPMAEPGERAARGAVADVDVDLDDPRTRPRRVDRHGGLDTKAIGPHECAEQLTAHGSLARQRRARLEAGGPGDAHGGQPANRTEAATAPGGEDPNREIGLVARHRFEQWLHTRRTGSEIGVDQEVDLRVRGGGDPRVQRATLSAVDRERDHARARGRGAGGRLVTRTVVHDDHLAQPADRAQPLDRRGNRVVAVERGNDRDDPPVLAHATRPRMARTAQSSSGDRSAN